MAQAPQPLPLRIGNGVANRVAPTKLSPGYVIAADNVDFSDSETTMRREGFTQLAALSDAHSFWTSTELPFGLVCAQGQLYSVHPDGSLHSLVSGLNDGEVDYQQTPLGVYWSNGVACGRIGADESVHPWGVELVPSFGLAPLAAGGLDAGRYGVALAFASASMEEGAATPTQFVDVSAGGGIQVSGIPAPQNAGTAELRMYVTAANGTELLFAGAAVAGTANYAIGAGRRGRALGRTQFCAPFPAVQHPMLAKGRLFGALGSQLIWTEPMYYGLYNPSKNFISLHGEPITMVCAPESEEFVVYLGTDMHTYVLRGGSIDDARISIASHVGVIPGSMTYMEPDVIGNPYVTQPVPVWVDKRGVPMMGTATFFGMQALSEKFVYPLFDSAAACFSQSEGMSRYIVAGRGGAAPGLAVADRVVAKVNNMGGGN